ncbi:MAG: solute carrier family 23 protein [Oscillospiraceae bacterium]|nr:solute carrier family 23 protein [Oscillospiraceae bacterium]
MATEKPQQDKNSLGRTAVLSFQHMFAMFGATVIVPILANMSIAVALLSAGVGTILFYFITKKKVPVFLGSSFAFLPALIGWMSDKGEIGSETWNQAMGSMAVAIWVTGLVYVVLSQIIRVVGAEKVKKLFPPIVVGPVIIVIGMILAPKMFYNNIILQYSALGSVAWKEWSTALITAATIVGVAAFSKPKSLLKVAPILAGFVVGYIYAACIGLVSFAGKFSWDEIVIFQHLDRTFGFYKCLHWDWNIIVAMVPIALVAFMEHLGDISANSAVCGKNFMLDPGIDHTLMGDGVATIAAGALGGPPNTTYGENTAVLAITQNYNPRNIFYAACMAVVFGLFTVFGNFVSTIPQAVIGGASIILFGMISSAGLRTMVDAQVDFSDTKSMMIVSIVLALGLGLGAMSLAGDITGDTTYKIMAGGVEISPLAIATFTGIILNLIIPNGKSGMKQPAFMLFDTENGQEPEKEKKAK